MKAPVFSMSKLIGVDTYLGPEMKSTGEVMGIDTNFPAALAKALMSADLALTPGGGVLLSIADRHKTQMLPVIHQLHDAGFRLYATEGTAGMIAALGLPVEQVTKRLNEGHPNVVDVINDGSVVVRHQHAGRPLHRHAARRLLHPPRRDREAHPVLHQHRHRARRRRGADRRACSAAMATRLPGAAASPSTATASRA